MTHVGSLICALRPFVSSVVPSDETTARDVEILKSEIEDHLRNLQDVLCQEFTESSFGYVPPIVAASATVDLPNIGPNSAQFIDVTPETPAPLGTHILSWAALTDATSIDDLIIQILVVAADTIRITMHNPTGGGINPDPITFQFITATAQDT